MPITGYYDGTAVKKHVEALKMVDEILMEFTRDVHRLLGDSLSRVILYGSYARGDYNSHSDMDMMVLTTLSDAEIEKSEKQLFDLAFDFQMKYFVDISVIIKNEDHFRRWLGALPFYDNVQWERVVLYE